jgi:hypothetical protein
VPLREARGDLVAKLAFAGRCSQQRWQQDHVGCASARTAFRHTENAAALTPIANSSGLNPGCVFCQNSALSVLLARFVGSGATSRMPVPRSGGRHPGESVV